MVKNLTERQQAILEFIVQENRIKGVSPSIREIANVMGISSPKAVLDHLKALERKGYIRRGPKARAIKVLRYGEPAEKKETVSVPLLGHIAAGQPILAEENIEEYISVEKALLHGAKEVFLLKVHGDSMIEDQILDGDIVIVRSQPTANNGDIVVALLENEATVKRFYRMGNRPVLVPSNPKYLIIEKDFIIQGRVIGVLSKEQQERGD